MIQAIIFDMDGVLISNSEPLWQRAEIEVFGALGISLTHQMCLQTRGLRLNEVVAHWDHNRVWETELSREDLTRRLGNRALELIAAEAPPLAGALAAVRSARARTAKLGLASSSPRVLIDAVLARLGIAALFDQIHSAEHERYGKPHPAIYLTIAERLGAPPTECLAIEDSLNGVLAAKAARMRCLAVPAPDELSDPRFSIADAILPSLVDLNAHWERLTA